MLVASLVSVLSAPLPRLSGPGGPLVPHLAVSGNSRLPPFSYVSIPVFHGFSSLPAPILSSHLFCIGLLSVSSSYVLVLTSEFVFPVLL